jgi:hypothetical protein
MEFSLANIVAYSIVAGLDSVVGVSIIMILIFSPITQGWTALSKLAMLTVAIGIIGQSIALLMGVRLTDPVNHQIWILKDIGIAIWALSLCGQWIDCVWLQRRKKD